MSDSVLEVTELSAGHGGRRFLHGASLTLSGGQLLGLIGPNGAGKSTLLRAIAGLLPARSGRVSIGGHDMATDRQRALSRLGYAVDPAELPGTLTGQQYLEMVASVRGCMPEDWPEPGLDRSLGFEPWLDTPLSHCSLGTRAKLSVAGCLLGAPPLLVLDESLNGLDPLSSWRLRQILLRMVGSGRHAAILSTHQIELLGSLCTDAAYIADGRIAHRWTRAQLDAAGSGGVEAMVMATLAPDAMA